MADRSPVIRLAIIDGSKVKATLRDVGDTGSRFAQRIEDAARPASRALPTMTARGKEIRPSQSQAKWLR
jgi:hypothetical protein